MKRSPLKRSTTPLHSYVRLTRGTPIKKVSAKRQRAMSGVNGYAAFSKAMRAEYPICQIRWPLECTGKSEGVHHVIKRSHGGALRPGPLADAQGQVFLACCNSCNTAVEKYPIDARLQKLTKDNPLHATDLSTAILYANEDTARDERHR